ncbi:MAG: hypothetical protein A2622_07515 [Bdellovibrionales bacterium RIFCSPHIGHO2_01_FULL_40_29]|nr:MAG: hypothetical protein A2622_07515 [Bdellovibrionales bacterium RIFCSPHIGHO2_01_FULL_40_29]
MNVISIFFLVFLAIPNLSFATTIICSSETGALKTDLIFSFEKQHLEVSGAFSGMPLKSFVFLSDAMACGKPIASVSECTKSEIKDLTKSGEYDFQFSCADDRRGELHFENDSVMAYCYNSDGSLSNQKGSDGCKIDFK